MRLCGIQRDSRMHSEKLPSSNEDFEVQFEEIILKNDDDELTQNELQSENKLVKSCPRTHVDNFHYAAETKE